MHIFVYFVHYFVKKTEHKVRSEIKMNEFILYFARFALNFVKEQNLGGTSEVKMNEFILYFARFALNLPPEFIQLYDRYQRI